MALWRRRLLLLLAWVTIAASATQRGPNEYESKSLCPAGHHVSRECDGNLPTCCRPCAAGTFMAYSNMEDECLPCTQCRDDEEVVTPCSPQSDQQCQCRQGAFFCDSAFCRENCYRCTSSGSQKSKNKLSAGPRSLRRLWGEPFPPLPASGGGGHPSAPLGTFGL